VSEEGGDLFGGAVNAAARICAKAQGGEALVSDVVRQLCGTSADVAFRERGLLKLRGFPERWRLYQAVSPLRAVRASERSPFVGREAELMELRRLMGQGDFAKGQPDSDGCLRGGVGAASRSQVCRNSRQ